MKEKGNIKVSLSIVIFVFIILLLLIVIAVLYYFGFVAKKAEIMPIEQTTNISEEQIVNTNVEETEKSETTKTQSVGKVDESKDIVYTEKKEGPYEIPVININSKDVKMINEEIVDRYNSIKDSGNEGVYHSDMRYKYYINNNWLSLEVIAGFENDVVNYTTYNIDINTGKPVTNLEIIHSKNLKSSEYLSILDDLYKKEVESYEDKSYGSQYYLTTSRNNYSVETPIFLDENGKINVVANIYSLAGAESYYHILNINK